MGDEHVHQEQHDQEHQDQRLAARLSGIPSCLSGQAVEELLQRFGGVGCVLHPARRSGCSWAEAFFPTEQARADALRRLSSVQLMGYKLRARPMQSIQSHCTTAITPATLSTRKDRVEVEVAAPISEKLGLMYSSSSELEYAYPPPTPAVLSNISSALLSVPRLYQQLLHLMNKMNLPPPFDERPFPSLPRSSGLRRQREQQQQHEQEQGDDGADSESESDSETDMDMDSRAPKRARRQRHPIKIVLHSKPCSERQVLSMEQIVSDRLSNEQIGANPSWRKALGSYKRGTPSQVLFIKNIAKAVTEHELYAVFARYFASDEDMRASLVIRLMKSGRMKGQAFARFGSVETAARALTDLHGYCLHSQPLIIQFGRAKVASSAIVERPDLDA